MVTELHRGRLIDHLHLVVSDIEKSRAFYKAVFTALGIPEGGKGEDYFWYDELYVSNVKHTGQGQLTGRHHLAFQAEDRAMVERFYEAGLKAGGKENGKPGERPYHPGYYGAFLLDPDGNNIEAVFHGPAKKSTGSVIVKF